MLMGRNAGFCTQMHGYKIGGTWLSSSPCGEYLGVLLDHRLSVKHEPAGCCGCQKSSHVFINDLDEGIEEIPKKFADDTDWGGVPNSPEDGLSVQEDLDRPEHLAVSNKMLFNGEKWAGVLFKVPPNPTGP